MRDYWPSLVGLVIATVVFVVLWRQGVFLRLSNYWRETMEELRKCTWPTWDELMGSTVVVIVSVAFLGGFTVGVDAVVAYVIQLIV